MNLGLTILLIIPLVGAFIASLMPQKQIGPVAAIVTLIQIGFLLPIVIDFKSGTDITGFIDELWIPELGIHYSLGIDGLNLFMICLVVVAWTIATFAASRSEVEQPRMFYAMLALAEVGTLGAFLAQDLILFVLFFDLLLIPFYFLIGMWGKDSELGNARKATVTFMIYTLAGSLLMLVSAVALGVITSSQAGTPLSFQFVDLQANLVGGSTQNWLFLGFMIALLVKMPIPPLHGWMPITYKATPLPVLIVLSAVVAKLGAYGFLRVAMPLMPNAVESFQVLLLILAVIAIIYGSVMAFSQDDTRLVVGYSSIAQIGFILLGIFVIDGKGAEGAILQMINHGVVTIGLFLVIAFLGERVGSEKLSNMGGLAKNAPVFATLFLIVALATLAMPGSANFVGETYILFGAFQTKFVWGVVASIGVVLAAVYMLRMFQRSMQNRGSVSDEVTDARSRELDSGELALLLPVVLIVLAMAVYPQYVVERVEPNAEQAVTYVTEPQQAPSASTAKESEPAE